MPTTARVQENPSLAPVSRLVQTSSMPPLFDPLRALQQALHAFPSIKDGRIVLHFEGRVAVHQREEARRLVRVYEKLLVRQIESGGASVQKLLAQLEAVVVGYVEVVII